MEAHSRQGVCERRGCSCQEGWPEAHPCGGAVAKGRRSSSCQGALPSQLFCVVLSMLLRVSCSFKIRHWPTTALALQYYFDNGSFKTTSWC